MEIFICLCPRDSSQSILDFDAFARDQKLLLGSIAPIFFGGNEHTSYLIRHNYLSYPGLTEDSTMHLWCECLLLQA